MGSEDGLLLEPAMNTMRQLSWMFLSLPTVDCRRRKSRFEPLQLTENVLDWG